MGVHGAVSGVVEFLFTQRVFDLPPLVFSGEIYFSVAPKTKSKKPRYSATAVARVRRSLLLE